MCRIAASIASIHAGLGHRADRRPDRFGKCDDCFAGAGLGKPNHGLAGGDHLSRLAKRFDHRSIRVCHQDGIGRLVLGDPCFGFGGGELRLGCIRRGLRLLVALSGSPSFADQIGVSPFIGVQLNDRCARRGNGVALRRERKAKVGFVDPHQRLTGFDLLPDIHQPFHDLAGDAKAEIALHPRRYDAREAAFGSGHPRGRHQSDDRRFLPRVAHGSGFLRRITESVTNAAAP